MVSSSNTSPRPTSTCKWGTGVGTINLHTLSPTQTNPSRSSIRTGGVMLMSASESHYPESTRIIPSIASRKPPAIRRFGCHLGGKVWIYSRDLLCCSPHRKDELLQTPFRKDLMTSVHIRLLRCLERYQTAQRAHEFRHIYIDMLLKTYVSYPIHS